VKMTFKLKTRSTATSAKNDQRSAITVPANATVVLVAGDLDEGAFVKIRCKDKALFMLSEDLRNGEPWEEGHSRKSTGREGGGVVQSARE
jgi:hypothetical protein